MLNDIEVYIEYVLTIYMGFLISSVTKETTCSAGDWFNPCIGKIPWRKNWQATPVFLPGKSYGQRSLVGYGPWGHQSQTKLSN